MGVLASHREFFGQGWMKLEKNERTPYIMKTTKHFNDVSTGAGAVPVSPGASSPGPSGSWVHSGLPTRHETYRPRVCRRHHLTPALSPCGGHKQT